MNKYGVCFLSVIPLRSEPSDKAEILTQLLFGEVFNLLETGIDGKWTRIRNAFDNYEGWIDSKHIKEISLSDFIAIKESKAPLVAESFSELKKDGITVPVFLGTPLPFLKNGFCEIAGDRYEYQGNVIETDRKKDFPFLKNIAFRYLNAPYLWGGKSFFGIDCSGFTQQVFRLSGYNIPRDAYQQAGYGQTISFSELLPGDMAFFSDENGKITHVGIILENYQIIHSSGQVRIDVLDEKGIFNKERNLYTHKFHSLKRVIA